MHIPLVTTGCAGLLGLIFLVLSARVVQGRNSGKVLLGDGAAGAGGSVSPLLVAIRSHANFAEYVPICLILIGGLELQAGPTVLVKVLAAVLVLARLAHPIGMGMPGPNPLRAGGFVGTMLVLLVASVAAVIALFQ